MQTTEHVRKVMQNEGGLTVLTDEMIQTLPNNYVSIPMLNLEEPEPISHVDEMDAAAARDALSSDERLSEEEVRNSLRGE